MRRRRVVISDRMAAEMIAEAKRHAPNETGGVLLGWRGRGRVEVVELVDGGPAAHRERHRFAPDGPWQRAQIAERYERSGRTLKYLGDWHSHPAGSGPSPLDHATAAKIAETKTARCEHPIFVVPTCRSGTWKLFGYRFATRRLRGIRVEVRTTEINGEPAATLHPVARKSL
jgi:integrative and conjugative element protein (TIGR02256 family)